MRRYSFRLPRYDPGFSAGHTALGLSHQEKGEALSRTRFSLWGCRQHSCPGAHVRAHRLPPIPPPSSILKPSFFKGILRKGERTPKLRTVTEPRLVGLQLKFRFSENLWKAYNQVRSLRLACSLAIKLQGSLKFFFPPVKLKK